MKKTVILYSKRVILAHALPLLEGDSHFRPTSSSEACCFHCHGPCSTLSTSIQNWGLTLILAKESPASKATPSLGTACTQWLVAVGVWMWGSSPEFGGEMEGLSQIPSSPRGLLRLCWHCFAAQFLSYSCFLPFPSQLCSLRNFLPSSFCQEFAAWRIQPATIGTRTGRRQVIKWDLGAKSQHLLPGCQWEPRSGPRRSTGTK